MARKGSTKAKKGFRSRTFFLIVAVLLSIIIVSAVLLFDVSLKSGKIKWSKWVASSRSEVTSFPSTVVHQPREAVNESMEEEVKSHGLTGNQNESMVKDMIVETGVFTSSEGYLFPDTPKVVLEDVVFGPEEGFADTASGQVLHFLNASMVNRAAGAKNCSIELSTINDGKTVKTNKYVGVLKPQEKKKLSLLLFPIAGNAQLSVKPVCL